MDTFDKYNDNQIMNSLQPSTNHIADNMSYIDNIASQIIGGTGVPLPTQPIQILLNQPNSNDSYNLLVYLSLCIICLIIIIIITFLSVKKWEI